jgi:hypothetical protein
MQGKAVGIKPPMAAIIGRSTKKSVDKNIGRFSANSKLTIAMDCLKFMI